jgi:hypothetical protein
VAAASATASAYTIQMAESDVAREFNPSNVSFHPILASASGNLGATNNILPPFSKSSLMQCSDCHESDVGTDPNGPHGSAARFILKGPNTTWDNTLATTSTGMPTGAFCANCHRSDFTGSRFTSATEPKAIHTYSRHQVACFNCHAAVPHGGPRMGILVAPAGAATAVGGAIAGWDTAAPYSQPPGTTNRLYLKSFPATNAADWSQTNCGCNGTGH